MSNIIELKNVNKWFDKFQVLKEINLEVKLKEKIVVCGPSGSGKSTLIRCINRLEEHQEGTIVVDGSEISENTKNIEKIRAEVGMVFQQFNLFPHLSILDNCTLALIWVKKLPKKKAEELAMENLKGVQIDDQALKFPGQLSGGQQQRTALARALVKDSDLILLDEPLANLDFKLREELREELPKLFENRECIVVYATTEPTDALMMGGNTATLLEGKVIQYGKTLDVYNNPKNLNSAEVFSEPPMNITEVKKVGDVCSFLDGSAQWKTNVNIKDGNYKIGIRPHNVTINKNGGNSVEIKGKILISELSGSESLIHFKNGKFNWVSLSSGSHQMNIGDEIKLYMNVDESLFFDQNNRLVKNG